MAKHPQENQMETIYAVAAMRDRAAAIEKVESWLARGWNPLLPQKPRGRCGGMALIEEGILQTMAAKDPSSWKSLADRSREMGDMASREGHWVRHLASKSNPSDFEAAMSALGLSPNARLNKSEPAFFGASPWMLEAFERLGADLGAKDDDGQGVWERAMLSPSWTLAKLDELAKRIAPSVAPGKNSACMGVLSMDEPGKLDRLVEAGASAESFGVASVSDLVVALRRANDRFSDAPRLGMAIMRACGQALSKQALSSYAPYQPGGWRESLIERAMYYGNVATLGAWEREGLITAGQALKELGNRTDSGEFSQTESRSCAWALRRVKSGDQEAMKTALAIWTRHPRVWGEAKEFAEELSKKGWLPDAGEHSLRQKASDVWTASPEFESFAALCEQHALKAAMKGQPKAAKRKPMGGRL